MPTIEDVRRILDVATSPQEIDFFYDQLTSPEWVPALRELGLFGRPPVPIEQGDGIMFPGWSLSRYLVRVAPKDPALVAGVLPEIATARNPRIWWDIVNALLEMPTAFAIPFLPSISRWIHHPYRLGIDTSAIRLAHRVIEAGAKEPALALSRSFVQLVPPDGWPEGPPWIVLDDYEYGEEVPRLGRALAVLGLEGLNMLVEELARFLEVKRPTEPGQPVFDYSFIWRPAIEDHEQNLDHDRESKLVVAIRDAALELARRDRALLAALVDSLLANPWPAIKRVGIHMLVENGPEALDLVGRVVTDGALLVDDQLRHELYRLVATHFAKLPAGTQQRYYELVEEIAPTRGVGRDPDDAELLPRVFARRWLGVVAAYLPDKLEARYETLTKEVGEDPHPDFPAYLSSWRGPTSPISPPEVRELGPADLLAYLGFWQPDVAFGPHPSREGLAQTLAEAAKEDPVGYASTAPAYAALHPQYASGLLSGLREAAKADRPFEWEPVLQLCETIVAQPVMDQLMEHHDAESRWASTRIDVARLLETGLEDRPSQIPVDEEDRVWKIVAVLAEDPDPTREAESRFGPPNMDPLTYSLNAVRGVAFHAAFTYVLWRQRSSGDAAAWTIAGNLPEVAALLEAHLVPEREPSLAIRAAYGWWLPQLIHLDQGWVRGHLELLLDGLANDGELALWYSYLARGSGIPSAYEVLARVYERYAVLLAGMEEKPGREAPMTEPDERYIDHLVRLWVTDDITRTGGPLETMLRSRRTWLVSQVVEEAGRLINRSGEVSKEIAEAFRELWAYIRRVAEETDGEAARASLGGFAWWFDSPLAVDWTLPELVDLLARGVRIDPEFEVFGRLGAAAEAYPTLALQALEALSGQIEEPWVLRAHENEIRAILTPCLRGDDEMLKARAEVLIHRLGRAGLNALGGLLATH